MAWSSPTTSGTVTWAGPLETMSVTFDPCAAWLLPDGLWSMTVPAAWFDWRACGVTVKPACCRVLVAVATSSPVTSGTVTWAGAATTLRVTVSPLDTLAGGFGV